MRIDKWLVFARFFKTRTKVTKAIEKKMIFLNGSVLKKQSQLLKLEDDILIKKSTLLHQFFHPLIQNMSLLLC